LPDANAGHGALMELIVKRKQWFDKADSHGPDISPLQGPF
jgi:hypothetical protein